MTSQTERVTQAQARLNYVQQEEKVNALVRRIQELNIQFPKARQIEEAAKVVTNNYAAKNGYNQWCSTRDANFRKNTVESEAEIRQELQTANAALRVEQAKLAVFKEMLQ